MEESRGLAPWFASILRQAPPWPGCPLSCSKKFRNKYGSVNPHHAGYIEKFSQIKPPLSALEFRNIRLRLPELQRHFCLRHSAVLAGSDQHSQKIGIGGAVHGVDHARTLITRIGISQNRLLLISFPSRQKMDQALAFIQQDDVLSAMTSLFRHLAQLRAKAEPAEWQRFAKSDAIAHPIRTIAHLCPMTRRSFDKPRGYAGDAVMLDHIYGIEHPGPDYHPATLAGKVYAYTINSPASRAVRYRRQVLARLIDETANRCGEGNARIFSIAAGHLREAELSAAVQNRKLAQFDAMDQDRESLQIIERDYARYGVHPRYGTVRGLLRNKTSVGDYDLVYAAGLFDYLAEPVARKLVESMLGMLRPEGKLLIANFARNIPDVGYMETFMDWWLIYRDSEEVRKLFPDQLRTSPRLRLFTDAGANIIFAEFSK